MDEINTIKDEVQSYFYLIDKEIRASFKERDSKISLLHKQFDIFKAIVENLSEKYNNLKINTKYQSMIDNANSINVKFNNISNQFNSIQCSLNSSPRNNFSTFAGNLSPHHGKEKNM